MPQGFSNSRHPALKNGDRQGAEEQQRPKHQQNGLRQPIPVRNVMISFHRSKGELRQTPVGLSV